MYILHLVVYSRLLPKGIRSIRGINETKVLQFIRTWLPSRLAVKQVLVNFSPRHHFSNWMVVDAIVLVICDTIMNMIVQVYGRHGVVLETPCVDRHSATGSYK